MGFTPDLATARIKQLIPLDNSVCALLKTKTLNPYDGEMCTELFDAISNGDGIYRALYCDRDEYDGNISTYDVAYYDVPRDCVDGGFVDPDDIFIIPNYKCENCNNRMIPSVSILNENDDSEIHYRCPVCSTEMDFYLSDPTQRIRGKKR